MHRVILSRGVYNFFRPSRMHSLSDGDECTDQQYQSHGGSTRLYAIRAACKPDEHETNDSHAGSSLRNAQNR